MNVLDLFSGIGGFSLGLERAGMRTVAFCEIDPYCQRVLRRHWPDVPVYDDVRTLTAARLAPDAYRWRQQDRAQRNGHSSQSELTTSQRNDADRLCIDLICGGFPCQDISVAGKGAGIGGERSGLWSEYARIIGEVRPRYVIVENVAALLGRGIATVLGDLAALGFDAEWHCIPASAVGAPHRRDRVWIIAHHPGDGCGSRRSWRSDPSRAGKREQPFQDMAHADGDNGQRWIGALQMGRLGIAREIADHGDAGRTQWAVEPGICRVAHGVSARVDRLRALGNAVVPQIPEIIGRAIIGAKAMSDIVERLRRGRHYPYEEEAAAEIEHLRAESDISDALLADAKTEVEQLRTLLGKLHWKSIDKDNMEYSCRIPYNVMNELRALVLKL